MFQECSVPTITVELESELEHRPSVQNKAPDDVKLNATSNNTEAKSPLPPPGLNRLHRLRPLHWHKPRQINTVNLLPSQVVVYICIILLFGVNFVCFFFSLTTVTKQEDDIDEAIKNRYSTNDQLPEEFDSKKLSKEELEKLQIQSKSHGEFQVYLNSYHLELQNPNS